MSKRILVFVLVVMLVAALVPVTTASNTTDTPQQAVPWLSECNEDLTGETITIYHFGDISGPYAIIASPIIDGINDALEYYNANGGLCGAEVVQENRDTGGDTELAQSFYDEFAARDDAYSIFIYASADGELLRSQAAEDGVVLYNAASSVIANYGENGDDPGWHFSIVPLYTDQFGLFCDYIADNWDEIRPADVAEDAPPVIGHLSWAGAFGEATDTDETRAYCSAAGVEVIGAEYFAPTTVDVQAQLQGLVDDGANVIYTTSLVNGPAAVASTVITTGLDTQVLVGGVNWAMDLATLSIAGENAYGIIGNMPFLWWDELSEPGVQTVTAYWTENRLQPALADGDPTPAFSIRNVGYLSSFGTVDLWMEGMIRAINEVGYENMSGDALYAVLQEMEYEAFDGIIRVDFTNGSRTGAASRIGIIGEPLTPDSPFPSITPITDWTVLPDLKPGGADVPE